MHDCDFIPPEYRERCRVRAMVRRRAVGLGALAAVMLVWIAVNRHRISSVQAMMTDVGAQKSEIESVAARKSEMENIRSALNDLQALQCELSGHRSLVVVFSELSRRMPETVILTGCHLYEPSMSEFAVRVGDTPESAERESRQRPSPAVHGRRVDEGGDESSRRRGLTLVGVARSIPEIIDFHAELDKSPLFLQVNIDVKEAVVFAGLPARRFELNCRLAEQEGVH